MEFKTETIIGINRLLGSEYLAELYEMFQNGEYEAILNRLGRQDYILDLVKVDKQLSEEITDLSKGFEKLKCRLEFESGYVESGQYQNDIKNWSVGLYSFLGSFEKRLEHILWEADQKAAMLESIETNESSLSIQEETKLIQGFESDISNLLLLIDDDKFDSEIGTGYHILPQLKSSKRIINLELLFSGFLLAGVLLTTFYIWGSIVDGKKGPLNAWMVSCFIGHITLALFMINLKLRPKILPEEFSNKYSKDPLLTRFFTDNYELYKYYTRATLAIGQFGNWWVGLGYSFLVLYMYYFLALVGPLQNDRLSFLGDYQHLIDTCLNTIEAFFLMVIYSLLTDNTIKNIYYHNKKSGLHFIKNVQYKKALVFILSLIVSYILLYFFHDYLGIEEPHFRLVSRVVSGLLVAICLSLIIGRLDSKFIDTKKWWLAVLYLYAAIQSMFVLFDIDIFKETQQTNLANVLKFYQIKVIVLYIILPLKLVFIYFILMVNKSNRLFYYFLLGSRINDFISKGVELNPWIKRVVKSG